MVIKNVDTLPAHEISKYIKSVEVWALTASVDVASCHWFAQLVGVIKDGQDVVWRYTKNIILRVVIS